VKPASLHPIARRFSAVLLRRWPAFRDTFRVRPGGHFEAVLKAPAASRAVALVCSTSGDGDAWVRLGPPNAFYAVDTPSELIEVVGALLAGAVSFAVSERRGRWTGTTLVRTGALPQIEPGERCRLYSWSGDHDLDVTRPVLSAGGARRRPGLRARPARRRRRGARARRRRR
jgi:hypothetical protein